MAFAENENWKEVTNAFGFACDLFCVSSVRFFSTQLIDPIVGFIATDIISYSFSTLVATMQDFLSVYIKCYSGAIGYYLLLRFSYILNSLFIWNLSLYGNKISRE
jgi:hypothetical protein